MPPIGLQLYTVRELAAKDFAGTLRKVASIGYAGVEFAGLHGLHARDVAALLAELGLKACSAHTPMPTAENIESLAADAKTLGYTRIISGSDSKALATTAGVEACTRQYAEGSKIAKAHGLTLGLHNHWWELDHVVDGKTPYESILAGAPDVFSELDVYWCQVAGHSPAAFIPKHASRIPLLHIKDGDLTPPQPMKAVGSGKLDFPAIAAAANPRVLEWMIVELDSCATDMLKAVADSYQFLTSRNLAQGRR